MVTLFGPFGGAFFDAFDAASFGGTFGFVTGLTVVAGTGGFALKCVTR